MLLKSADDKSPRLALMENLLRQGNLSPSQHKWASLELMRLRKGIEGERQAAHYLDNYFKDGQNHVILHDLRFEVDGETAQIDHLVFNRGSGIYLIETKNYAGNLVINEQGEFTVDYDGERFGIPSPIEQSRRHERVLTKLMDRLGLNARIGERDFYHVVLLHPKAQIVRPAAKSFDTSMVIKADQFPTWHQKFVDKTFGVGMLVKVLANMRSLETITEWAEKLLRQHRPADQLTLPPFMESRTANQQNSPVTPFVASPVPDQVTHSSVVSSSTVVTPTRSQAMDHPLAKKLICVTCGGKISFPEGKFCWNNAKRFGGLQYCREHQAAF